MVSRLQFARYALVGLGNTLCHWVVFGLLHFVWQLEQALSNFGAFLIAVNLSYCLNARFTFSVRPPHQRYWLFLIGMASLSLLLGAISDQARLPPWLTLVTFSIVSLTLGYWYSRSVVFVRRGS